MAQKKQTVIIRKVYVNEGGGGHHGGSWKVAFADFMTAMMAFFLVMWLIGQSEESRKAMADYFSTPSVIEYNYQNYGAEITLEKLFLDFLNEPLKAFQSFMQPMDKNPNILDTGSAKIVAAYMAEKMNEYAKNINIDKDGFDFDIPDYLIFAPGTSKPKAEFVNVMARLSSITTGLKEAEVKITSSLYLQLIPNLNKIDGKRIAQERLELISNKINASFESPTNTVTGNIMLLEKEGEYDPERLVGYIKIRIHQKSKSNAKRRPLETVFGRPDADKNVYDNFAKQIVERKAALEEQDGIKIQNPVDAEMNKISNDYNPENLGPKLNKQRTQQ